MGAARSAALFLADHLELTANPGRGEPHRLADVLGEELADVLIYLAAIANREGIDLSQALREKEALNETRTWS